MKAPSKFQYFFVGDIISTIKPIQKDNSIIKYLYARYTRKQQGKVCSIFNDNAFTVRENIPNSKYDTEKYIYKPKPEVLQYEWEIVRVEYKNKRYSYWYFPTEETLEIDSKREEPFLNIKDETHLRYMVFNNDFSGFPEIIKPSLDRLFYKA